MTAAVRMQPVDHYTGIRDARRAPFDREERALALFEPRMRAGTRILDAGCGDGTFLRFVEQRYPLSSLQGVDFSSDRIEGGAPSSATLKQTDLNVGLPYDDASFDVVYSGEVLEHLFAPDTFLRHVRRVLVPGGLFVLSTPNLLAWYNRALVVCGVQPLFVEMSMESGSVGVGPLRRFKLQERPVGHIRIYHRAALEDLLVLHGFRVRSMHGTSFERFPPMLRRLDALIARLPSLASELVVAAD